MCIRDRMETMLKLCCDNQVESPSPVKTSPVDKKIGCYQAILIFEWLKEEAGEMAKDCLLYTSRCV